MKELVTVFAALAVAGAVVAADSNIVGYQTVTLNQGGFTHIAPTFITIGGVQEVPLSSFVGDFEEFDSIQLVDAAAGTASEYFWLESGSMAPGVSGWYADDLDTYMGALPVEAGTSFLYLSGSGATALVLSGEVGTAGTSVTAGVGFTAIGNSFPVETTLGAIGFAGITEFSSVQFVDLAFGTAEEYFWLESGSMASGVTGWYADDLDTYKGTLPVAAGQGFLLSTDTDGVVVSIASPL